MYLLLENELFKIQFKSNLTLPLISGLLLNSDDRSRPGTIPMHWLDCILFQSNKCLIYSTANNINAFVCIHISHAMWDWAITQCLVVCWAKPAFYKVPSIIQAWCFILNVNISPIGAFILNEKQYFYVLDFHVHHVLQHFFQVHKQ